jgi:hypothetical protein
LVQAARTDQDMALEKERSVTTRDIAAIRRESVGGPARLRGRDGYRNARPAADFGGRNGRRSPAPDPAVAMLRELASAGELAEAAAAGGSRGAVLVGAAYTVVWPVVFARLTRRFEQQRGHLSCAAGVGKLRDACLDRFHDDVEAVVDDLLIHARKPILHLEAWVATRLGAATVNAHRRRRATRGALQRPRLPGWLAAELGGVEWLGVLATNILTWVGVGTTAGGELWPLEVWAQQRAAVTGDWAGSDPAAVERDVVRVLAAMRRRPDWYDSFVERPLGSKEPPVAAAVTDAYGEPVTPLSLADPDQRVEEELHRLAHNAVRVIGERLRGDEDAETVVAEVIRTVFGGAFTGALDRAPYSECDPAGEVSGALVDRERLATITSTALAILREHDI